MYSAYKLYKKGDNIQSWHATLLTFIFSVFPLSLSFSFLPCEIFGFFFLMSCPASWPQKFDVLRFYIIIQIDDKIAKTKARIKPWVKVQEPFLQGHMNLYIGTVGIWVQLVIHQSNRSCSQSLFLPSIHRDIEKPYQTCCSRLFFHPSLPHLVSLWVLLIPLQNVSHRSSSPTSLQSTHLIRTFTISPWITAVAPSLAFSPLRFLEKTWGSSAYVYSNASTLSEYNHYLQGTRTILHSLRFVFLSSSTLQYFWGVMADLLPKWQRI